MNRGSLWWRAALVLGLVACGGSDKKTAEIIPIPQSNSSFLLRMNVEGLNGQLTLANHESNPVTINSNGMTTMPVSWNQHSTFEIRVKEEPCAQRCVVDEPTGQIQTVGSKTLNISCASKTWEFPTTGTDALSVPGTHAETPLIAMNQYGDMALTWYQNNYFNLTLYKRLYQNRKWEDTPAITDHYSFQNKDAHHQSLDMNDDGEVVLAWSQSTSESLYKGTFDGNDWQLPTSETENISFAGGAVSDKPHVIRVNKLGEKILVWAQAAGGNIRLYKAEYRNGQWIMPTNIVDNINPDGTDVSWMDAAIDDLGNILIAWQQSDGNYESIYKSEYRNGVWTHPISLADDITMPGTDAYEPKVAMNTSGDTYVTWYQKNNNDYYQVFMAEGHSGTWFVPTSLDDNITPDGRHAKYPRVVVNEERVARIAYTYRPDNDVNVYQVASKQKLPGGDWGSTEYLTTSDATSNSSKPAIAMDDQGNVVVVWSLVDSGKVYKAEYRNEIWTLANLTQPINFNTAMYDYPAVAVNNCRAAIAWQQENDSGIRQIYVAQYR